MLELIPPSPETVRQTKSLKFRHREDFEEEEENEMPVDFASYLLSSSPPGFDINYALNKHFGVGYNRNKTLKVKAATVETSNKPVHKSGSLPDLRDSVLCASQEGSIHESFSFEDVRDVAQKNRDKNTCQHNKNVSPSASRTSEANMGKKRVSFADECGMNLVSIKVMTESSDTPPQLRPHFLSSLTRGATAGVTETPPLMLNFSQPASDYLAFREKIERNCVCLENVILKDYNIIGTIKVKNIAFEKSVKVRCTFDSWESCKDFPASYVPSGQQNVDTFAFEIRVPPNMNIRKKVQFCVCFQANCQEFWDSNDGANYEVVSANLKDTNSTTQCHNTTDSAVYNLHAESQWSEYSGWSNMDNSCPYW